MFVGLYYHHWQGLLFKFLKSNSHIFNASYSIADAVVRAKSATEAEVKARISKQLKNASKRKLEEEEVGDDINW